MKYSPNSQTLVPRLHTADLRQYLSLSIIQPLEVADALLSEAGRLAEAVVESSDKDNFYNILLNDFVEAKTNREFLDKEFLLDKDLDQNSDLEDIHQNTSLFPEEYDSFKSHERESMNINDINASQLKSYQH